LKLHKPIEVATLRTFITDLAGDLPFPERESLEKVNESE